ncbi:hypothetical protein EDB85DRAFT_415898 [Lactarius pseudohatsudake]|nr:hypothetical protein EDB85DRAFT_415898 [Lactarius pseudohatsudake]
MLRPLVRLTSATSTTIYPASDRRMDRTIHDTCARTRSEHPDPGPIIPSFPPQTSVLLFSGFPPDDLPTESTIRSFDRLFASPICGLARRKGFSEGDDVGHEGASYNMLGCERSALSLTQELQSECSDTTHHTCMGSCTAHRPRHEGRRAHLAAPARTLSPHHHARSNDSEICPLHTLSHLTAYLSPHREPPALPRAPPLHRILLSHCWYRNRRGVFDFTSPGLVASH